MSSHGTEGSECIQSPVGGIDVTADIDWKMLRHKATEAAAKAYAPYSGLPVGAAALVDDHRMVAGCNVENVSYGLVSVPSARWSAPCIPAAAAG